MLKPSKIYAYLIYIRHDFMLHFITGKKLIFIVLSISIFENKLISEKERINIIQSCIYSIFPV